VFKFLKKVSYLILIVLMLLVNFFIPKGTEVVEAKTLRDLKQELEQKQQEYKNSQSQKELTEGEIASTRKNIDAINTEISNIQRIPYIDRCGILLFAEIILQIPAISVIILMKDQKGDTARCKVRFHIPIPISGITPMIFI
jgi:hypothetical protein